MAPSLRDAVKAELMRLLHIDPCLMGRDRTEVRRLVDHVTNPETYRNSPDKLDHEKAGRHGSKRGGHYYWLLRQIRRMAEEPTPEWYATLITRDTYNTCCVEPHRDVLLASFPLFDCQVRHEEQSQDFLDFDRRMQVLRGLLDRIADNRDPTHVRPRAKRPPLGDVDVVAKRAMLQPPLAQQTVGRQNEQ